MLATTYSQSMLRLYLVASGLEPVMDYVTGESSPVTRKKRGMRMVSFFSSNWAARAVLRDITGDLTDGISPGHNR
jgi:hypothetical protein